MNNLICNQYSYRAERYEEWIGGRCISRGSSSTSIHVKTSGNHIHFELSNLGNLKIKSRASFLMGNAQVLHDGRVQYSCNWDGYSSNTPIVCHVFYDANQKITCIRFAMTNPDRLIEFYGSQIESEQSSSKASNGVIAKIKNLLGFGVKKPSSRKQYIIKGVYPNAGPWQLYHAIYQLRELKNGSEIENSDIYIVLDHGMFWNYMASYSNSHSPLKLPDSPNTFSPESFKFPFQDSAITVFVHNSVHR